LIGPVFAAADDTYAGFREFLKKEAIVDYPFNFWDVEDGCRLLSKLERFNGIGSEVFVIAREGSDEEPGKRRRMDQNHDVVNSEPN
jgi:hypothetical protein